MRRQLLSVGLLESACAQTPSNVLPVLMAKTSDYDTMDEEDHRGYSVCRIVRGLWWIYKASLYSLVMASMQLRLSECPSPRKVACQNLEDTSSEKGDIKLPKNACSTCTVLGFWDVEVKRTLQLRYSFYGLLYHAWRLLKTLCDAPEFAWPFHASPVLFLFMFQLTVLYACRQKSQTCWS